MLGSAVLLSASFEPFGVAPLAWVALVGWLMVVATRLSPVRAFCTGWLGGVFFFAMNIWWLWTATIPGTAALVVYLSLYWGLAAAMIRGLDLVGRAGGSRSGLQSIAAMLLIAVVWTATEWLRAYLIPGFPWLLLGHSQTRLPVLCQIADITGVSGITFCVALVNAWFAAALMRAGQRKCLAISGAAVAGFLLVVSGYGVFRLGQDCTVAGPSVLIVQPNHAHLRGGGRTVSRQAAVEFHLQTTREALAASRPDLVVWSETVMPPLNTEARAELKSSSAGRFLEEVHCGIRELSGTSGTTIVTGANYVGDWLSGNGERHGTDLRNSVYYYFAADQSPVRYDKTELVPFAEKVPFESTPWLHRLMLWLAPPVARQPLVAGDPDHPGIFELPPRAVPPTGSAKVRFITPICLENTYPPYVARLLRPGPQGRGKKADFIVNLSNDGWFNRQQHWQHWQAVVLRCIENRVPMARSSNTGISGFVDSGGRARGIMTPGREGTLPGHLDLDRRLTFYTRCGEWFGPACAAIVLAEVIRSVVPGFRRRRTPD